MSQDTSSRLHATTFSSPTRRAVLVLLVLLAALLPACAISSTAPEVVSEQWQYVGSQRVPNALQLDGALRITRRTGERFEGSLDLRRTDVLGRAERVTGLVNGRRSGATLDFEATLEGAVIRHIGSVRGDSITGTWIDDDGGGTSVVAGTFTLVRTP